MPWKHPTTAQDFRDANEHCCFWQVDLEIDSEADRAVLAKAPPTSGLSVRTGRSRRDIAVATSEPEAMDADATTAAAAVTEKETSSEETGEEGGGRNGAKRKRLEGQRGTGGRSRAAAAQPNGNPASKGDKLAVCLLLCRRYTADR